MTMTEHVTRPIEEDDDRFSGLTSETSSHGLPTYWCVTGHRTHSRNQRTSVSVSGLPVSSATFIAWISDAGGLGSTTDCASFGLFFFILMIVETETFDAAVDPWGCSQQR